MSSVEKNNDQVKKGHISRSIEWIKYDIHVRLMVLRESEKKKIQKELVIVNNFLKVVESFKKITQRTIVTWL